MHRSLDWILFFTLAGWSAICAQEIRWLTPNLIDMGRVKAGLVHDGSIRFVNNGTDKVTIRNVITSCGCTTANVKNRRIAPGDTADIEFSLLTYNVTGTIRKPILIQFNDRKLEDVQFTIQAQVIDILTLDPRYLYFHGLKVNPDTVVVGFVTIQNETEESITCTQIYSYDRMISVEPASLTLPPGGRQHIRMEVAPYRSGQHTVYINIETDQKAKPKIHLPVYVQIEE